MEFFILLEMSKGLINPLSQLKKSNNTNWLSQEFLEFIFTESRIFRLYPGILESGFSYEVLPENIKMKISNIIDSHFKSVNELIEVHHVTTGEAYKLMMKGMIEWSIQNILHNEYLMILSIKKYATMHDSIESKYLKLNLSSSSLELIESTTASLIRDIEYILNLFTKIYNEKNIEWKDAYMELNRNLQNYKYFAQSQKKENVVDLFLENIQAYIAECKRKKKRTSITGLAEANKIPRQTFVDKIGPELNSKLKEVFKRVNNKIHN